MRGREAKNSWESNGHTVTPALAAVADTAAAGTDAAGVAALVAPEDGGQLAAAVAALEEGQQ